MKCPRCGYVFRTDLDIGFRKEAVHPHMIYICDNCDKEVHNCYSEKIDKFRYLNLFETPLFAYKERRYLCVDCMRKSGNTDELLNFDKQFTTDGLEEYTKERFKQDETRRRD